MQTTNPAGRLIAFQHRRKKTKAGEARPTILAVKYPADSLGVTHVELEDDLAELDFVHGFFPTAWRPVQLREDLSEIVKNRKHHIHFRKPEDNETLDDILKIWPRESLDITAKGRGAKKKETLVGIPSETASEFDGMKSGDTYLGIFGGSGFNLIIALINRAAEIGARVFLTSPKHLKIARDAEHAEKKEDADILLRLYEKSSELFHEIFPTDVQTWEVMHSWDIVEKAMKTRIETNQLAEAIANHNIYASNKYLGSQFAKTVLEAKKGDRTLLEVQEFEDQAQEDLEASIEAHPLSEYLFGDIKGCGPRFFGKIMSAIRDIRRFPRIQPNGKGIGACLRFSGFAVEKVNGRNTIQRFRRGGGMPGNPVIKQGIWLWIDMQVSKQKDTVWGMRFREIKEELHKKHPLPELVCDTEIPLIEGKYTFDEADGSGTIDLGKSKSYAFTGGKISTSEKGKKVLIVPPETIPLPEGWSITNGICAIPQPGGKVMYRPGTTRYTKIHIHKIAMWKLGTEFIIWMFKRWWQYVDEMEAKRKAEKENQPKAA